MPRPDRTWVTAVRPSSDAGSMRGSCGQVAEAALAHDPAGDGLGLAAEDLEQAGLAGAVATDEADLVPGHDGEVGRLDDEPTADLHRETLRLQHRTSMPSRAPDRAGDLRSRQVGFERPSHTAFWSLWFSISRTWVTRWPNETESDQIAAGSAEPVATGRHLTLREQATVSRKRPDAVSRSRRAAGAAAGSWRRSAAVRRRRVRRRRTVVCGAGAVVAGSVGPGGLVAATATAATAVGRRWRRRLRRRRGRGRGVRAAATTATVARRGGGHRRRRRGLTGQRRTGRARRRVVGERASDRHSPSVP